VDRVGSFTLARPDGQYDLLGNQLYSNGQIRFETIQRFKGQEAPAIILTDVPPEAMGPDLPASHPAAAFHGDDPRDSAPRSDCGAHALRFGA
jgi:hypothetical protein